MMIFSLILLHRFKDDDVDKYLSYLIFLSLIQEGFKGFGAMSGRSVLLLAELFISDEASQNGVSSQTVDGHEDGTNTVCKDKDDQSGEEGRVDFIRIFVPSGDDEESTQGSDTTDKDLAESDKDTTDTGNNTESQRISHDEEEGVLGRDTEVFTSKGNLDISVLVQESNESFETSDVALETSKSVLHNFTILSL